MFTPLIVCIPFLSVLMIKVFKEEMILKNDDDDCLDALFLMIIVLREGF